MSNNDEQLDQFLRLEFSQKKFVQKTHYWNKAQQLIAADRANSSKEYFSAVFSAILLIGLSIGMLWNSGNTKAIGQQEGISNTHNLVYANNVAISPMSNTTNTSLIALENNSENTIPENQLNNQHTKGSKTPLIPEHKSKDKLQSTQANTRNVSRNNNTRSSTEIVISKPSVEMQRLAISSHQTYFPVNGVEPLSKKNQYLEATERKQKNYVAIEAGINNYNIGTSFMDAINAHLGIRYYHFIAPKWGFSSGLTYVQIHQNMDERKYDNINFSFGQENNQTTIVTKQVNYVEVPIAIHYNMLGNHFINAGATVAYAVQAKSEVSSVENNESKIEYGYLDAINRTDIQLNIGYSYMAGQKWIVTSSYHYGLMDVSNNSKFKSNSFDSNSGIRITLGYKLF